MLHEGPRGFDFGQMPRDGWALADTLSLLGLGSEKGRQMRGANSRQVGRPGLLVPTQHFHMAVEVASVTRPDIPPIRGHVEPPGGAFLQP